MVVYFPGSVSGFELGLEWAGLGETIWQVENNKFCQKVLAKHWPNVKRYGDIKDVGKHNLEPVDLICGGFPCQPFSVAGKRKGKEDDRYLWHEMLRVIAELEPSWVIGENVFGIINMELDQVLSDLENIGYETTTFIIPACAVNAPHRRDRVWVIANTKCISINQSMENSGISCEREKTSYFRCFDRFKLVMGNNNVAFSKWQTEGCEFNPRPMLIRNDDGIPHRVDRLKSLGNAVVPQVSYAIGMILKELILYERINKK